MKVDPFPFPVFPPVAHVERSEEPAMKDGVRGLAVVEFGGTYAGS